MNDIELLLARLQQQRRNVEERLCQIDLAENKNFYLALKGEIRGIDTAIQLIKDMYGADI